MGTGTPCGSLFMSVLTRTIMISRLRRRLGGFKGICDWPLDVLLADQESHATTSMTQTWPHTENNFVCCMPDEAPQGLLPKKASRTLNGPMGPFEALWDPCRALKGPKT